ncbi:MAG TPA: NUDIX hydrolase [Candidatus Saccharimonadales bacterium]
MSDWKVLSSEEVYRTPWIKVRRDKVLNHSGKPLTYSVVELHHPTVFIVAANSEAKILLQKSYRYTIDREMWELPAGHSEGQDYLEAARRELLEETGLASDDWTHLGRFYQAVGVANFPLEAYLARNVRETTKERDNLENILEQKFVSFEEIESMALDGSFDNSTMLGLLYLAKLRGQ